MSYAAGAREGRAQQAGRDLISGQRLCTVAFAVQPATLR
jgi:hypothetical protein